jgi:hypothetical protein
LVFSRKAEAAIPEQTAGTMFSVPSDTLMRSSASAISSQQLAIGVGSLGKRLLGRWWLYPWTLKV